jgi:hypothetical protein
MGPTAAYGPHALAPLGPTAAYQLANIQLAQPF